MIAAVATAVAEAREKPRPGAAPRSHRWLRLGAPARRASALGSAGLRRCHGDAAPPPPASPRGAIDGCGSARPPAQPRRSARQACGAAMETRPRRRPARARGPAARAAGTGGAGARASSTWRRS
ncbi:translation initiation factor IF-2-like [Moschus berezovskii]|uniref:translation initiation factor IF-2-like n=1 Tax=Moschus berezovskii TaxID=68408 RepID=UPI0024452647|nr:translation initiation factor IF-2-like [Moschus berezovskii]